LLGVGQWAIENYTGGAMQGKLVMAVFVYVMTVHNLIALLGLHPTCSCYVLLKSNSTVGLTYHMYVKLK
jgi:hydrogenase/urease accessory protein HupE